MSIYFFSFVAKNAYYELRDNCIGELLRPHLVIYLDIPVSKVQENIKKRAIPYEKNSPVLTPKYLRVMENVYKQQYLKEMRCFLSFFIVELKDINLFFQQICWTVSLWLVWRRWIWNCGGRHWTNWVQRTWSHNFKI